MFKSLREVRKATEDELIEYCEALDTESGFTPEGKQLRMTYLLGQLSIKEQKKLLEKNASLVKATWTLAVVTSVLAIISWFK